MSRLTTHVLDSMHGRPAAGVGVRLSSGGVRLVETATNADGRCGLLAGAEMKAGIYRLEFDVGAYYRGLGVALPEPPFLDVVALEFGVADVTTPYHVPLLVSPYAYSTYRGS